MTIYDPGRSIALSFTDTASTPVPLVDVGEDGGAKVIRVVASAPVAPTSAVVVDVVVGAEGTTAGAGDYSSSSDRVSVTIAANDTSGTADVTITPASDTITEDLEIIRFAGSATGYAVVANDLVIQDQDRAVKVMAAEGDLVVREPREGRR